uniref:Multiple organellar RNA editing factor 1 isoform X2 n=2 Tax=Rhizophora mucronata TaxID=61149 RepID=A0A2P2MQ75_RHIMU
MPVRALRLRRALTSLYTVHCSFPSQILPVKPSISPSTQSVQSLAASFSSFLQSRLFTASPLSPSPEKQYKLYKEGDEITEDTVLFEGCDFNHWLITVDFPKDPKPTPEEMVATYERICAQGLKISIEEAKMKIYACSTTTYQGFQAIMTEEESEKFKDVPGVVFVLPDSYIDPLNKEYGGDKYENGVITPRPPPVQYQRGGGRSRDRNRNFEQHRYDRQGFPMPNRQGSPPYDQQGFSQGANRNYGPPQNYPPQQNYGPPQNYPPQQNYSPPQNFPAQQNYSPQNFPPQQNYGHQRNYAPQQTYRPLQDYPAQQTYGRPMNNNNYQPRVPMPSYQGNYNQAHQGNTYAADQRDFPQGFQRDPGFSEQRDLRGDNRNYSSMYGGNGQGTGQDFPAEDQSFSLGEQTNKPGVQGNYSHMEQTGSDQGRY